MLEPGRISVRQLIVVMLLIQIGDMILVYPSLIAGAAQQDAWLASLIGIPFGLFTVWIMLQLYKQAPGLTLIEGLSKIFGKWMGAILGLWYLFYFMVMAATIVREAGDFLTTQILPETPIRVIHLILVIVLVWGIKYGLESLSRAGELLIPIVVMFIAFQVICLLPQIEVARLEPVFASGAKSIAAGAALAVAYPFGELLPVLMLIPYALNRPHRTRDLLMTALIGFLMLTMIVTVALMVLGPFFTQHSIYASFILSQRISIGNFLERIESVMATIWIISTYFKAVIYFYCFVLGSAQLFTLRSYRPIIMPSGMIIFGMAIILAPTLTYYQVIVSKYWVYWDLTCALVIPLCGLLVCYVRKRWSGQKLGENTYN